MSDISIETQGDVLTITFDRPEKKNAFTRAMYSGVCDGLEQAATENNIRVVVLRGAGGAFTGGNDLKDFMNDPPRGESSPVFRFLKAITSFEKPIIAQVEGPAVGIGSTMLLHADLVYASETAKFVLPFVNLGLVPEAASTFLMPRLMGHQRAAELLFFGEPFDAETAVGLGLVNRIVPGAEIEGFVDQRAARLAEQPPDALRKTKALLKAGTKERIAQTIASEGEHFTAMLTSPEAMEAFMAFFEKRKPDFKKLSPG